jgi:dsDNA-binding SOS-regulon protein
MAVEVKYVVVRNGEEKMTFATKKEADAYDKMLDLADTLSEWLSHSTLELEEAQRESVSFFLAEHKDALSQLLRGGTLENVIASEQQPDDAPAAKAGRGRKTTDTKTTDDDQAA